MVVYTKLLDKQSVLLVLVLLEKVLEVLVRVL